MMQLSGEAEASGATMSATIQALAHGTKWDGEFNPEYALEKGSDGEPSHTQPYPRQKSQGP